MIITNPTDPTKTYDSSKRGRRPTWANEMLQSGKVSLPEKPKAKTIYNVTDVGLKAWKWKGGADEDSKPQVGCIVMANSDAEAMSLLNNTMKLPVSQLEFLSCWKRIDHVESIKSQGVYVLKDSTWEERPNIVRK